MPTTPQLHACINMTAELIEKPEAVTKLEYSGNQANDIDNDSVVNLLENVLTSAQDLICVQEKQQDPSSELTPSLDKTTPLTDQSDDALQDKTNHSEVGSNPSITDIHEPDKGVGASHGTKNQSEIGTNPPTHDINVPDNSFGALPDTEEDFCEIGSIPSLHDTNAHDKRVYVLQDTIEDVCEVDSTPSIRDTHQVPECDHTIIPIDLDANDQCTSKTSLNKAFPKCLPDSQDTSNETRKHLNRDDLSLNSDVGDETSTDTNNDYDYIGREPLGHINTPQDTPITRKHLLNRDDLSLQHDTDDETNNDYVNIDRDSHSSNINTPQDTPRTRKHLLNRDDLSLNHDTDDETPVGLFEVSVDISEGRQDNSETSSPMCERKGECEPVRSRRPSRWSATVLFLASEVQMMVNLARLSQPDGYEMAPKKNKDPDIDSDNDSGDYDEGGKMADRDSAVELQPMDGNDSSNDQQLPETDKQLVKNYSNGDMITVVCEPSDLPPAYDNVAHGGHGEDQGDGDQHSTNSDKSEHDEEKPDEEQEEDNSSTTSSDIHPPHEDWGHKADFLLAVIGYAVDLSNVWRFPYLCYRNGGGAFIIPYFTVLIFGALPIFFMELCLGQYHREGPITVWKIAPIFKGIGYASCFMSYIVAFYYNVIIGWAFYYLFSSFTLDLPWNHCDREWNSPHCWKLHDGRFNMTANESAAYDIDHSVSSSYEFFEREVLRLHLSKGLDDLGGVRWELVLCTMLTFICLYFSLWKGVKSSGKVVYVTATVPYLILLILLIRGCLLPGAIDGIKYFITPNLSRLGDPRVWTDAAVQIMFSIGAGFGTHIAYASHNKFNNNCYADCLFTAAVNSFTSIFSGFVVFSYLGYMADRQQKHIDKVAQEGPGLVFIVYPEAIATLPGSSAWAIIFFIMLITLGMDSAFGGLESPLTGLSDSFYRVFKNKYYREILTFIVIVTAFLFSIPCNTWGGMYVFKILDTFAAGTSILFTVLCQVVAVGWFYGIDQFCKDIHEMIGHTPGLYWRICWKFLSPTFLLIIVVSSIMHYAPLAYEGSMHVYTYPTYANVIGWLIACASMSIIPLYMLYYILTTKGTLKQRISLGISPKWEHKAIKDKKEVRRFKREHWVYL